MNQAELEHLLAGLALGEVRYFDCVGSTNDEALTWLATNPPPFSVVIADEQTAGRGRTGRRWLTPRGAALAVSVILYPQVEPESLALINGLGALAISDALATWGLASQIKWPNDVLLNGRKVAGILPEAQWMGETLRGVVLGMGINVRREAAPPAEKVHFPAGSVEEALGQPLARERLLREGLFALKHWVGCLEAPSFVQTWEERLAFRGELVKILLPVGDPVVGTLLGLTRQGNLRLRVNDKIQVFSAGEIQMRPV
ncbi:MAG TPA: biotin--[acetyl-CoA-carboxylase] ligase [Anaerolineales bacterium]|nr:biotin--[acetyl-CoA-carboxylase] ligase [Anaerolineales bacterium]